MGENKTMRNTMPFLAAFLIALIVAVMGASPLAAATATTSAFGPSTTNNDDSCDIALLPAATLLLPYFEVDFNSPQAVAKTTLFTIQNTSYMPQIARVTIWTDWAYPAITFNVFLTGYDVQSLNLYDIFARGVIAPGSGNTSGTSINTTIPTNPTAGSQPGGNLANPNFSNTSGCGALPGALPAAITLDLQSIFTTGKSTTSLACANSSSPLGGTHANAAGYVTIDLVANCSTNTPATAAYFNDLLFDNVLTGDTQSINPNPATGNYAGGNPLVHIRAVPEGGHAGQVVATTLPYTFYDHLTTAYPAARTIDRRQPLPSVFAPRYIQGGTGAFNTTFKMWREAGAALGAVCTDYSKINSNMGIAEVVRFDEHENATVGGVFCWGPCLGTQPGSPAASNPAASATIFPPMTSSGDVAGWFYMNLSNEGWTTYSVNSPVPGAASSRKFSGPGTSTGVGVRQSQNWIVTSMSAEGRFSVDMDAVALGNGCSPSPTVGMQIGPLDNATP